MTIASIGYYSTLTMHPQTIQGSYYQVYNDPLYVKDMTQHIYSLSDESIFKENKPYERMTDLLTADENYVGKTAKDISMKAPVSGQGMSTAGLGRHVMTGSGVFWGKKGETRTNLYGFGVTPAGDKGGSYTKVQKGMRNKIMGMGAPIDRVRDDIKKGATEVHNHIKNANMKRRDIKEMYRIGKLKKSYPGQQLRNKLIGNNRASKRTEIKNLLQRLR